MRNLADPMKVDSANPNDPMAQLAVVMLALFAQMERTYMLERVAHARSVAVAHGRQVGRPVTVDQGKLDYARRLRDQDGLTVAEIVRRTGLPRTTLYRHLPPRPVDTHTAAGTVKPSHSEHRQHDDVVGSKEPAEAVPVAASAEQAVWTPADERGILQSVTWPVEYQPPCPVCTTPSSGLREQYARVGREQVVLAVAHPCGCGVDDYAAALQTRAPANGR